MLGTLCFTQPTGLTREKISYHNLSINSFEQRRLGKAERTQHFHTVGVNDIVPSHSPDMDS